MKKVNYIVTINGRDFKARKDTVITANSIKDVWLSLNGASTLNEVYGHYSQAKASAWNNWMSWLGTNYEQYTIGLITSHSCMFFTLQMLVKDKDTGTWWLCTATGRNNYAVKIEITE